MEGQFGKCCSPPHGRASILAGTGGRAEAVIVFESWGVSRLRCEVRRDKENDPQSLLKAIGLMDVIRLWARSGLIDKMAVERIFALMRKSGGTKAPTVDRLIPSGF